MANMCLTMPGPMPTASTAYFPYYQALVAPLSRRSRAAGCWRATTQSRRALVQGLIRWCEQSGLSSLHLLFASDDDVAACRAANMMLRHNVQFHWTNRAPMPYRDVDDFLASLNQEKRKKIRQERLKS